jgi:hypothetical protein
MKTETKLPSYEDIATELDLTYISIFSLKEQINRLEAENRKLKNISSKSNEFKEISNSSREYHLHDESERHGFNGSGY